MSDGRLKSFVERIAKLHEERKAITADITEVVNEAKGVGYIPKTLRKVVARYLEDPAKLAEDDALIETYEAALGRVGKALAAVRAGSTWEEASKENDVPRATLARAAAVSKQREVIPDGEDAAPHRSEDEQSDALAASPELPEPDSHTTADTTGEGTDHGREDMAAGGKSHSVTTSSQNAQCVLAGAAPNCTPAACDPDWDAIAREQAALNEARRRLTKVSSLA